MDLDFPKVQPIPPAVEFDSQIDRSPGSEKSQEDRYVQTGQEQDRDGEKLRGSFVYEEFFRRAQTPFEKSSESTPQIPFDLALGLRLQDPQEGESPYALERARHSFFRLEDAELYDHVPTKTLEQLATLRWRAAKIIDFGIDLQKQNDWDFLTNLPYLRRELLFIALTSYEKDEPLYQEDIMASLGGLVQSGLVNEEEALALENTLLTSRTPLYEEALKKVIDQNISSKVSPQSLTAYWDSQLLEYQEQWKQMAYDLGLFRPEPGFESANGSLPEELKWQVPWPVAKDHPLYTYFFGEQTRYDRVWISEGREETRTSFDFHGLPTDPDSRRLDQESDFLVPRSGAKSVSRDEVRESLSVLREDFERQRQQSLDRRVLTSTPDREIASSNRDNTREKDRFAANVIHHPNFAFVRASFSEQMQGLQNLKDDSTLDRVAVLSENSWDQFLLNLSAPDFSQWFLGDYPQVANELCLIVARHLVSWDPNDPEIPLSHALSLMHQALYYQDEPWQSWIENTLATLDENEDQLFSGCDLESSACQELRQRYAMAKVLLQESHGDLSISSVDRDLATSSLINWQEADESLRLAEEAYSTPQDLEEALASWSSYQDQKQEWSNQLEDLDVGSLFLKETLEFLEARKSAKQWIHAAQPGIDSLGAENLCSVFSFESLSRLEADILGSVFPTQAEAFINRLRFVIYVLQGEKTQEEAWQNLVENDFTETAHETLSLWLRNLPSGWPQPDGQSTRSGQLDSGYFPNGNHHLSYLDFVEGLLSGNTQDADDILIFLTDYNNGYYRYFSFANQGYDHDKNSLKAFRDHSSLDQLVLILNHFSAILSDQIAVETDDEKKNELELVQRNIDYIRLEFADYLKKQPKEKFWVYSNPDRPNHLNLVPQRVLTAGVSADFDSRGLELQARTSGVLFTATHNPKELYLEHYQEEDSWLNWQNDQPGLIDPPSELVELERDLTILPEPLEVSYHDWLTDRLTEAERLYYQGLLELRSKEPFGEEETDLFERLDHNLGEAFKDLDAIVSDFPENFQICARGYLMARLAHSRIESAGAQGDPVLTGFVSLDEMYNYVALLTREQAQENLETLNSSGKNDKSQEALNGLSNILYDYKTAFKKFETEDLRAIVYGLAERLGFESSEDHHVPATTLSRKYLEAVDASSANGMSQTALKLIYWQNHEVLKSNAADMAVIWFSNSTMQDSTYVNGGENFANLWNWHRGVFTNRSDPKHLVREFDIALAWDVFSVFPEVEYEEGYAAQLTGQIIADGLSAYSNFDAELTPTAALSIWTRVLEDYQMTWEDAESELSAAFLAHQIYQDEYLNFDDPNPVRVKLLKALWVQIAPRGELALAPGQKWIVRKVWDHIGENLSYEGFETEQKSLEDLKRALFSSYDLTEDNYPHAISRFNDSFYQTSQPLVQNSFLYDVFSFSNLQSLTRDPIPFEWQKELENLLSFSRDWILEGKNLDDVEDVLPTHFNHEEALALLLESYPELVSQTLAHYDNKPNELSEWQGKDLAGYCHAYGAILEDRKTEVEAMRVLTGVRYALNTDKEDDHYNIDVLKLPDTRNWKQVFDARDRIVADRKELQIYEDRVCKLTSRTDAKTRCRDGLVEDLQEAQTLLAVYPVGIPPSYQSHGETSIVYAELIGGFASLFPEMSDLAFSLLDAVLDDNQSAWADVSIGLPKLNKNQLQSLCTCLERLGHITYQRFVKKGDNENQVFERVYQAYEKAALVLDKNISGSGWLCFAGNNCQNQFYYSSWTTDLNIRLDFLAACSADLFQVIETWRASLGPQDLRSSLTAWKPKETLPQSLIKAVAGLDSQDLDFLSASVEGVRPNNMSVPQNEEEYLQKSQWLQFEYLLSQSQVHKQCGDFVYWGESETYALGQLGSQGLASFSSEVQNVFDSFRQGKAHKRRFPKRKEWKKMKDQFSDHELASAQMAVGRILDKLPKNPDLKSDEAALRAEFRKIERILFS